MTKKTNQKKKFNDLSMGDPNRVLDQDTGMTRLMKYMSLGDQDAVKHFIKCGATLDLSDNFGRTALHHAVELGLFDMAQILVEAGARLDVKNEDGESPLYAAIRASDKRMVDFLITSGAKVNVLNKEKQMPLHVAAQHAGADVVENVFAYTRQPNRGDKYGVRPLHLAAHYNSVEVLNVLRQGRLVDLMSVDKEGRHVLHYAFDNEDSRILDALFETRAVNLLNVPEHKTGNTLLHMAVFKGNYSQVRRFVKLGADIDVLNRSKVTPLLIAMERDDLTMLKLLVSLGGSPNGYPKSRKLKVGETPLIFEAIDQENVTMFNYLVEQGADLNVRDEKGRTPLMVAAQSRWEEFTMALVDANVDVHAEDEQGRTYLHFLRRDSQAGFVTFMASLPGVDLNKKDKDGITPLLRLIKSGQLYHYGGIQVNYTGARSLLACGADPNIADKEGMTPLAHVVETRNFDMLNVLLTKYKADPNIPNNKNVYPIHAAIYRNDIEAVRKLVSCGADLNVKDHFDNTPLEHACVHSTTEIIELLLEKSGDISAMKIEGESILNYVRKHKEQRVEELFKAHYKKLGKTPPPPPSNFNRGFGR